MIRVEKVKYVMGDIHLGDDGMFNRAYKSTFDTQELYFEALVRNWNQIVRDEDIVLLLGDIGSDRELISRFVAETRGRKWLILGNHDDFAKSCYAAEFEMVFLGPVMIHRRFIASHEPVPVEPGVVNLHGHTHDIMLKTDLHKNLCAEHWGYKPVSLRSFVNQLTDVEKPNRRFLSEWYAEIQIPSSPRDYVVLRDDGTIDAVASKDKMKNMKNK